MGILVNVNGVPTERDESIKMVSEINVGDEIEINFTKIGSWKSSFYSYISGMKIKFCFRKQDNYTYKITRIK